jgi:glycosyltransferase involved in cell wall biosynthesis
MQISLIVTTYNRPDALLLVLKSVENQVMKPLELIIADDGSDHRTKKIIDLFKAKSYLNIIHSFQNDHGFRAARSRNKAIAKAKGDYIILVDGDMILQSKFVQDHFRNAKPGFFIQGSRVLVSELHTKKTINDRKVSLNFFSQGIKNRKNAIHSNILAKFFSVKGNYLRGIKTCNFSFYRKDCILVNGFNNDFEGWGREDSDFALRLMNTGIKRNTLRFNAIQYHLWHEEASRSSISFNSNLLQKVINENTIYCDNGINSFL